MTIARMKIEFPENSIAGSTGLDCWMVKSWAQRGFVHGFLGRDLDFRGKRTESEQMLIQHLGASKVSVLQQIHSAEFVSAYLGCDNAPADGWMLSATDSEVDWSAAYGILTADCFPVMIVAREFSEIALLHCGWRGTVQGIFEKALQNFFLRGISPDEIEVAIGPGALACCYEVSPEFPDEVARLRGEKLDISASLIFRNQRFFFDLQGLLRTQALAFGVSPGGLFLSNECTVCNSQFFSFRREKDLSGRQLSFIFRQTSS